MPPAALAVDGIEKSYGTHTVLYDFSLELGRGEFVSIVGRSGVGKTTLLRTLAGLEEPDRGTISLDSRSVVSRLGTIGYMPQRESLLPWRTVLDNVALALELNGESKGESRRRAQVELERFQLDRFGSHWPNEISAGMRQRVALLRTFLTNDAVVLLDEPLAALDAITRTETQAWLAESFTGSGRTILLVTHDIDEALLLSDRVLVLAGSPATVTELVEVDRTDDANHSSNRDLLLAALTPALVP